MEPIEFHAKAGDALIWSANLVHGGKPIVDVGRTRWSQVTHYFFDGCVYVTPLYSDPELGEWFVRADLENIATGQRAVQSYNDEPVFLEDLGNGRTRIHRTPNSARSAAEWQAEIDDLHRQVEVLNHLAQEAADQAAALRSSRSFKLGNAALAPARWARRQLRR